MMNPEHEERLVEQRVTFTAEVDGRIVTVERVPARVDEETGERYFSPAVVERLQEVVWGEGRAEQAETAVFDFAG
ncbi:MAG: YgiT-type zinc finger protein [Longimicrobiaceae bacterium]